MLSPRRHHDDVAFPESERFGHGQTIGAVNGTLEAPVRCPPMDAPVRLEVLGGETLLVEWEDGAIDRIGAAVLRTACPCAACQGSGTAGPGVAVRTIRPVGSYGVSVAFEPDGHGTGIYPWDLLRSLRSRS